MLQEMFCFKLMVLKMSLCITQINEFCNNRDIETKSSKQRAKELKQHQES